MGLALWVRAEQPLAPGGGTELPGGILGPSDGLTRSVARFLRGDVAGAHAFHPSGPALGTLLLAQVAFRLALVVLRPRWLARHWLWDLGISVALYQACLFLPLAVWAPRRLCFLAAAGCASTPAVGGT